MKVDAQTLLELLAVPGLPDDFELRLEVTITKGEIRRSLAAGAGAPRDLTLPEMAESVGRSLSTVRGWLADGRIPEAYKLNGRDWFCPGEAWTRFLESRKRKAPAIAPVRDEGDDALPSAPPRSAASVTALRPRKGLTLDSWRDVPPARKAR